LAGDLQVLIGAFSVGGQLRRPEPSISPDRTPGPSPVEPFGETEESGPTWYPGTGVPATRGPEGLWAPSVLGAVVDDSLDEVVVAPRCWIGAQAEPSPTSNAKPSPRVLRSQTAATPCRVRCIRITMISRRTIAMRLHALDLEPARD
jgi:hypothetical protein